MIQQSGQSEAKTLYTYWNKRLLNFLQSPDQQKQIPEKLLQKLEIIEKSIAHEQINHETYPNIEVEEFEQLLSPPEDVKITLYMSITKMFLKDDVIGKIDLRSNSKLFYNSKDIKLDFNQRTLEISRKKKSSENYFLKLPNYKAKWLGGSKRTYFELILVNDKHQTKYKEVMFGDEDPANTKQWFDCIKICCQSYEGEQSINKSDDKKDKMKLSTFNGNEKNETKDKKDKKEKKEKISAQSVIENKSYTPSPVQRERRSEMPQSQVRSDQQIKFIPVSIEQSPQSPQYKNNQEEGKEIEGQQQIEEVPKAQKIVPHLFQNMLKDGLIDKTNFLSDTNFRLMHFQKNLRILQNCDDILHFKAFLLVDLVDVVSIIQSIVNVEEMMKWNQQIEQQSRNLTILPDSETLIIYERRKKYGRLYLARDFVFMRHIIKNDQGYFILEKSTQHEDCPPTMDTVRGEINYGVWGLFEDKIKNTALLVYSINQTNGGYSSASQDSSITTNYLLQLENLEQYLKQLTFNIAQKNIPRYLSGLFDDTEKESIYHIEKPGPKQRKSTGLNFQYDKNVQNLQNSQIAYNDQIVQRDSPKQETYKSSSDVSSVSSQNEPTHDKSNLMLVVKETIYQPDLIQKVQNESQSDSLRRLLKQVEQANEIWDLAIHHYEIGSIDQEPKFVPPTSSGVHYLYKDEWVVDDKGGMKYVNQGKLDMQKEVLKYLLKKMGTNILTGKSVMSISLPVYIFEKRSNLERHAYSFTFAPLFLEKAALMTDPIEQMKEVVKFGISIWMLYLNMDKPFNPILGETYQGRINGTPIYCEQVSHHPPICSFFMPGRGYKIFGHLEIQASMGANSLVGSCYGYVQVDFLETQNSIQFNIPQGYISGLAYGDRMYYTDGIQWFVDTKNQIISELTMSASSGYFSKRKTPLDLIEGKIMKVNDKEIEKFQKETFRKYAGTKGAKADQILEVSGRYTSKMFFDEVECLDWDKISPFVLEYEKNPLASDAIYREDLIAWKLDDIDFAQERKEKLEVYQRNDKKLRDKLGSKTKKH